MEEPQPPQTPFTSVDLVHYPGPVLPDVPETDILPPWDDSVPLRHRVAFSLQSGEIVINPMKVEANEAHVREENVQFLDENVGQIAGFKYTDGLQHQDATTNVPLKDFLSRPVRIAQFQWNEADLPGNLLSIRPWQLFFNNQFVKPKTANFAFIRCNLKVKVLINASPFYYGAMLASYLPVPGITPSTIQVGPGFDWFIPISQRPHMWIYPANSEGGIMDLPFFWNKNWLRTQVSQEFADMGQLDFSAFTTLQSANGVSSAGVTVQVYAWAENVELSGPSLGLVMQTDEYGDGPISKPASAIAALAGKMTNDPNIGRFATATQMGARAVSKMATMFGFSNPPVLDNIIPQRPTAFPQMSNVENCFPSEKLTLDPKNELSVDPSIVGLPSVDSLEISRLVQKESFLTQIAWDTADPVDRMLFSSYVTPEMFGASAATQQTAIFGTPMWWVSRMFNAWRGDIIFRFKFVSTQFHKGRVRISWDPQGTATSNLFNTADSSNVVQTVVVDLGKDTDVEFRIPYHQAYPWCQTYNQLNVADVPFAITPTRTFGPSEVYQNGAITVRVQTALTSPVASSNVVMQVFVKGAENLEFANPGMRNQPISPFVAQSGEFAEPMNDEPDHIELGKISQVPRERYLVNFGETITTLRSLLYRHYMTNVTQATTTGAHNSFYNATFFRMPASYGYDPFGSLTAKGLITPTSSYPFNYTFLNPITWIMSAFVGYRGSMILTINASSVGVLNHVRVCRLPSTQVVQTSATFVSSAYVSRDDTAYRAWLNLDGGSGGSALTATRTQQGLTVVLPNYNVSKFTSCSPQFRNLSSLATGGGREAFNLEIYASTSGTSNQLTDTKLEWHFAGGPDLTPLFFVNVPTVYLYNSIPAP